ncbi:MAG: hypothetical protein FAF05_05480 [Epsilonproteobacteria bacterium]|nr:hypothetical protein [Campylobacterota bacterium]
MQRKNGLLTKQKDGFAMIMAIAVIVVIATIMALSLSLTSQTTKRTTDVYLYEQASLYAKAAAEKALLDIASQNPCGYTGASYQLDGIYNIHVTASYVYTSFPAGCHAAQQFATITTPEQNGSVRLDITVSVNDSNISTEPIRYFRRTIQKL